MATQTGCGSWPEGTNKALRVLALGRYPPRWGKGSQTSSSRFGPVGDNNPELGFEPSLGGEQPTNTSPAAGDELWYWTPSPWRWRVVLPILNGAVADADGPRAWWGRSHAVRAATTHPACGGRGRRACPRHWTAATVSFHPGRSDGAERAPCGWSQGVPVFGPGTTSATYFWFLYSRCRYPAPGRTKGAQGGPTSTHWA